ncbi:MAG: alpha/beta hydrolase [Anaerolineae bacterium]|nr:alpha/beta hydrolase [Anaerolineae bacterium]
MVAALTHDTFTLNGDILTYETYGDSAAPPLVLIHGWMGSKHDWRKVLPVLSRTHWCVAVDLLGHGESDKPADGDYSIPAQGRRVLAVADALNLADFTVCGHSMGGMIALTLGALLAPERITRMVNLAGIVDQKSPFLDGALALAERAEFLVDFGFDVARRLALFEWGQRLLGSGIFYKQPPFDFASVDLPCVLQPGMEVPFYRALEAIMAMDLLPRLSDIACPVLTVFGRQDRLVPALQGQIAARHIPDHRLEFIEACGHYLMLEKPVDCLALMCDFLVSDSRLAFGD